MVLLGHHTCTIIKDGTSGPPYMYNHKGWCFWATIHVQLLHDVSKVFQGACLAGVMFIHMLVPVGAGILNQEVFQGACLAGVMFIHMLVLVSLIRNKSVFTLT